MTSVVWLRRDLRRQDHPALVRAADHGPVLVLVVLDPALWDDAAPARVGWYAASVLAARQSFDGKLVVRTGDPAEVVLAVALEVGADVVVASGETEPDGAARDRRVRQALRAHGVDWRAVGCPYAVSPATLHTQTGQPYSVFTPFSKAWREHGYPAPVNPPHQLSLLSAASDPDAEQRLRDAVSASPIPLPAAGEQAALSQWHDFLDRHLREYDSARDDAAADATSRMSAYLKVGSIHPRTLLADLAQVRGPGAHRFQTELIWREFYADVLHHNPDSLSRDLKPALAGLDYDEPGPQMEAWRQGRTGYPYVDAGMRQLLAEGWMHNRLRMVTASFLTKDLHVWWPHGARHFLNHLIDGDLASNNHGWQWVAGTGTDAAPYFRIFNPVTQGEKFDPHGDYVRRWVPELRHLPGAAVHQPWRRPDGYAQGYPARIVDHAVERREALERYAQARHTPG